MTGFTSPIMVKRNSRLIILTSALLALIFVANALVSAYLLRKSTIQDRSEQLASLTVILAEHTSQILFSATAVLQSILDVVDLQKISTEKEYRDFVTKKDQFNLLQDKTKSNPILDVATFIGDDGHVLNFSRSYPTPDINLSERDYFQYLSAHNDPSTFYSVPVQNKGTGKWVFYLAHRINGANGQFLGVVLVGVSVEVFSSLYQRIAGNLGEGSAITLYRKDKTLLTRWPLVEEYIGKVNPNPMIDDSLSQKDVNGGVIFASSIGFSRQNALNVKRMLSYRAVQNYPFIVGAVVPESIYLSNWYRGVEGVFLATGLSLIAIFLGAWILVRTYRRNAENHYLAHHDSLTGLPNRILFADRLELAIGVCKRNDSKLAVLFIDLDNLKLINDINGHKAGDWLLKEVAQRIKSCVREADTVGRLGGDEFVVILPGLDSEAGAIKVAEKIRQSVCAFILCGDEQLLTSASIGIALYPDHGLNEVDLMNHADVAMYEAKTSGKNAIKVFDDGLMLGPQTASS